MHFKKIFSLLICMALLLSTMTYPLTAADTPVISAEQFSAPTVKAAGSGTCGGDLRWEISWDGETVLTISGTGSMYDYSTPSKTPWYSSRNTITKVVIENGATSVGEYAFYGFSKLERVLLPNSIKNISEWAFANCASLEAIVLGSKVENIGDYAFYSCNSLEAITVDENNAYYSNDGYSVLFNKDKTTLIQYPAGAMRSSYTVPDSVEAISSNAFSCAKYLANLTIGKNVNDIGADVFSESYALKKINVNALNESFSSDDNGVLFNYDKTVLIQYPLGSAETAYTVPTGVKEICNSAFYGCESLEELTISTGVEIIGSSAFASCVNLAQIVMPDSVKSVGYDAFMDTPYVNDISYAVNRGAYYEIYVGNVLLYIIDAGVTSGSYQVTLKDNTSAIAYGAFEYSYASDVVVPSSVKYLGDGAFAYCQTLLTVDVPDSVEGIGENAFEYCMNLTEVTLGSGVKYVTPGAFYGCESLDAINVDADNKNYKNDSFGTLLTSDGKTLVQYPIGNERIEYTVPDGVETIAEGAFCFAANLESVSLPEDLKTIEAFAFDICYNITDVHYDGNEIAWNDIVIGDYNDALLDANMTYGKDAPEVCGIVLISLPDKRDYIFGEALSIDGMTVYAVYTDDSKSEILNYSISGYDPYKLGKQTVTVFYSDFSAEFTVYVSASDAAGFTSRIEAGQTVAEFKTAYSQYDVYVYGFDGEELYDNEIIKTDYTVVVVNGKTIEENCYIIVDGDGNCDGIVNGKDIIRLKKHMASGNATEFDEYVDYNGDGILNDDDAKYLIAMIQN